MARRAAIGWVLLEKMFHIFFLFQKMFQRNGGGSLLEEQSLGEMFRIVCDYNRVTAVAVAALITKRDRVTELHYITRSARNVRDENFEVS